jgi:hypothetical protein
LRDSASNAQFDAIISQRLRGNPKKWFAGVASLRFADVRSLVAPSDTDQRLFGDRLYCVFDTDMAGLPHHADIIATLPRPHGTKKPEHAWRPERARLLRLMLGGRSDPAQFRGGSLASIGPTSPPEQEVP